MKWDFFSIHFSRIATYVIFMYDGTNRNYDIFLVDDRINDPKISSMPNDTNFYQNLVFNFFVVEQ